MARRSEFDTCTCAEQTPQPRLCMAHSTLWGLAPGPIYLTRTQARLVKALLSRANQVVSREEVAADVWGDGTQYADRANGLDVLLCHTRQRLGQYRHAILSHRGYGLRWHLG